MPLPVSRNILLIFTLAAGVMLFFGRIIYLGSVYTKKTDDMVAHTYRVTEQVESIRSGEAESRVLVLNYIINRDTGINVQLNETHSKIRNSIVLARQLAMDSTQKKWLADLDILLQQQIQLQKLLFAATHSAKSADVINIKNHRLSGQIADQLSLIQKRQHYLLQQRTEASDHAEKRLINIAIAGALLIILFIAALLWQLNKDINRRKKAEQEIRESENKYRRLIEGPGTITITANLRGEFEFVSAKAKTLTGYLPAELQGQSFAMLVPEEWQKQVFESFEVQFHNRLQENITRFPIITKTSELKWVKLTSLMISVEEQIVGFQCTVKDVSEEMEAESKLKESEELVQTLLNNINEGFFMVDRDLIIRVMNKPAREGMEMRTGKKVAAGMHLLSVIPEQIAEQAEKNFEQVFRGEYVEYEAKYETQKGPQWLRISHSPVREDGNIITGAAIVTSDITSIKLNEEKVQQANQKIRAMLASTNEGFYMIAPDHTIILVNEAGKKIMWLTTNKLCREGDSILQFIKPERETVFQKIFENVLSGRVEENELFFETMDGELWIHNTYFPVRDEMNRVIAVCISVKNVTEVKLVDQAWEKLREEREEYQFRLQSILDNTPLIMFVKDLNGRYLLINRSFKEAFSVTEEQVIGKTDFDFENDDDAIRYREADELVVSTLEHVQTDETVQMADGEHNLLIVKFPLFDKDDIVYGVGGIATDITERVQSRAKLVEAKRKAEAAEALQEQFLANMSHEIRTPLNGIIGMTNILQHTALTGEQQEFVQIIRHSSDNLLMLINDILDLSKIKAGKLTVESLPFSLKDMLQQVVAPFRLKASEKKLSFALHADENLPADVIGDPLRITQVLTNLLSNALKFTDKGSISLAVKLVQKEGEKVTLSFMVSDTGIGIPADRLESVFENFEQAATETTRKYGGTGLGLSITKTLTEMMGGSIVVTSEPEKGTIFRVHLCLYEVNEHEKPKQAVAMPALQNHLLTGKTILVAEDNEINQKVIRHTLQRIGIVPTITGNGKEAVELLEEGHRFDLIILDLQMPLMNGFQTSTYIRKKLLLNTPIVAMTASALRNEKMKCFELGMNEYLTKPFEPAQLFAVLQRFLTNQPAVKNETIVTERKETELYNLSHLYEMEDNDYVCEVLQLFLDTTPVLLSEIHEAALYENWEQVHKKAHKLKSSLGILQMNLMLGVITTVEQQAKEEDNVERIPDGLKRVNELFELIKPMIQAELDKATQTHA